MFLLGTAKTMLLKFQNHPSNFSQISSFVSKYDLTKSQITILNYLMRKYNSERWPCCDRPTSMLSSNFYFRHDIPQPFHIPPAMNIGDNNFTIPALLSTPAFFSTMSQTMLLLHQKSQYWYSLCQSPIVPSFYCQPLPT